MKIRSLHTIAGILLYSCLLPISLLSGQVKSVEAAGAFSPWHYQASMVQKIPSPSGGEEDFFGYALAMIDNKLFVGAPWDDTAGLDVGAVHEFTFIISHHGSQWVHTQTLLPSHCEPGQRFGCSLAVDPQQPELLAIGSFGFESWTGAVYLFGREANESWSEMQFLKEETPFAGGWYGCSMAIDGNTLVVGAHSEKDPYGIDTGNAYIYECDGAGIWEKTASLYDYGLGARMGFGAAVAVRGDTILVGAPYLRMDFVPGKAHAFCRDSTGWHYTQTLPKPLNMALDRFGSSLCFVDDLAVVGAPHMMISGSVTTYQPLEKAAISHRTDWVAKENFGSPMLTPRDHFGCDLSMWDSFLLVGAETPSHHGTAFLYERLPGGSTRLLTRIESPDGHDHDHFGCAGAIRGNVIAVGALLHDAAAADSGAVYIFNLTKARVFHGSEMVEPMY